MRSLEKPGAEFCIGSQVAAPWQDGIFYPGVVRSITSRPMGDTLYTVEFDDRYVKDFTERQIVGNCQFKNTKDIHLKFNQQVYVTHCEVEVCGFVQKHRKQTNEVFIKLDDSEETLVRKKLEEVRLLSRHSNVYRYPPLDDNYTLNSIAVTAESKKRTVTDGIEVPCAKTLKVAKEEEPTMNEVMAAMILTSLQTASPSSLAQCQPMDCTGPPSPSGSASCSSDVWSPTATYNASPSPSASSGHFSWDFQSRGTPSPGLSISDAESCSGTMPSVVYNYLPHSTPLESMPGALMFSSSLDEGIDMGESGSSVYWDEQNTNNTKKLQSSSKTHYKCTWQRCSKTLCTIQGIERHIRTVHLGKKESDFSDHEEEFYYTEVESTMEAFSDTFASMMASSPPPVQHDSNGNVVMTTANSNSHQTAHNTSTQAFFPTNIVTSQLKCNSNESYHSPNSTSVFKTIPSTSQPQKDSKKCEAEDISRSQFVQQPKLHQIASPPTKAQLQIAGLSCSTKIHAEGRKCRKVYGMENRRLWCTQCKWKKACVRFV